MSETEDIIRIAAKGDGVTASGRHARYAAPGDTLSADGKVMPGPHHTTPACRHFGKCGGCQLQHCDDEALAGFVHDRVANAAEGQGLVPGVITAPHMSPPCSRRRASLRAINGGGRAFVGFNEGGSHKVVDMRECHVLRPELMAARDTLAAYFGKLKGKFAIGVELTLLDQGVDCLLSGFMPKGLEQTEDLLDLCRRAGFARLSLDHGYGAEGFWEPDPATITLSGIPVACPPGAFLQATADGEAVLVGAAQEWLAGCANVADLFSGLGTFALALGQGRKVLAAEADRAALLSCRLAGAKAGGQMEASHRDLFRNPLRAEELRAF